MEEAFTAYLNTTKWSEENFLPQERISCSIALTIQAVPTPGSYKGIAQIVAARPVYGSTYQTALFNYTDQDWSFNYQQGQVLRYINAGRLDELSALLAFYALLVVATDYDSFGKEAGTPYFTQAKDIVSRVESAGQGAWSQYGALRNRYWLLDNLLDAQLAPLRWVNYEYHRHGLDKMNTDKPAAQAHIIEQLRTLQALRSLRPVILWMSAWLDAKYGELIALCSEIEDPALRQESYNILRKLDPTRTEKYRRIIEK